MVSNRVPYAEQPHVIAEHCGCPRDIDGRLDYITLTDLVTGEVTTHELYAWDCLLHGLDRKEAPF